MQQNRAPEVKLYWLVSKLEKLLLKHKQVSVHFVLDQASLQECAFVCPET